MNTIFSRKKESLSMQKIFSGVTYCIVYSPESQNIVYHSGSFFFSSAVLRNAWLLHSLFSGRDTLNSPTYYRITHKKRLQRKSRAHVSTSVSDTPQSNTRRRFLLECRLQVQERRGRGVALPLRLCRLPSLISPLSYLQINIVHKNYT